MIVKLDTSSLKQSGWKQYALRFAIGGFITVAAGLIAKLCGPVWGGLFLAFPAIFPATVTLVSRNERIRKARRGLHGEQRGLDAAAVNAAGATLGSVALAAFAAANWRLLSAGNPVLSLIAATAAWFLIAGATWALWKRRHRVFTTHLHHPEHSRAPRP